MERLLAIVGATGSGKSDLALELARRHGGEILSCDSVQVYRGFDIGCAKPTAEERAAAPHHLLDLVEWREDFDAQRWCDAALSALADVRARGRLPILCGGTGLYLRALRYGLIDAPKSDPEVRARLYAEERARPGVLYERLQEVDPASARRIEPHNLVYVVRALEILEGTGEPASRLRERHGFVNERVPMRVVALRWDDATLRRRIEARVAAMMTRGLVEEVRGLLARGVDPACRPMRSVGYRETCEVLLGAAPLEGLAARIAQSTWAYARRQRTWLRRERGVEWLEAADAARLAI